MSERMKNEIFFESRNCQEPLGSYFHLKCGQKVQINERSMGKYWTRCRIIKVCRGH